MQKRAENRSRRQCSRASASEAMTLMARPLMALKIDCRVLTNRVNFDEVCTGHHPCGHLKSGQPCGPAHLHPTSAAVPPPGCGRPYTPASPHSACTASQKTPKI